MPEAGTYFLDFEDATGWDLRVPAGRPSPLLARRGRPLYHAGCIQPMHFYVPKEPPSCGSPASANMSALSSSDVLWVRVTNDGKADGEGRPCFELLQPRRR